MNKTEYTADICIIGAGSGGLSVAAGAAQLGLDVVLFEAAEMGGDCLNHGCVPSKALIAAGKHAHAMTTGAPFGIEPMTAKVDWAGVKTHVAGVIEHIAPVDSQERFEGLGCTVIRERAAFTGPKTVESKTAMVTAKRFVIATGSRASAPPIPGLSDVPYLTNETIFTAKEFPQKLLIIGAGPIGLELGQAFHRLGASVDIVDIAPPLGRNEPEHAQILIDALADEGITFHAPARTKLIKKTKAGISLEFENGEKISGTHILVAAGRRPVTDGLGLDAAGVKTERGAITTNPQLRTSNPRIYAIGDVSGRGGLTHAAGHHASVLIRNLYFVPFFKSSASDIMPAAIYNEPELASIGLTEASAKERFNDVRTVHWQFDENDRAIAERDMRGGVKLIARKNGRIIGASAVGTGAGEIIQMAALAMANKGKIIDLTKFISPYPTRTEAVRRAASSWYTGAVFGSKAKFLAGMMARFH